MIATLVILGFTLIGSVVALFAAEKAPMGYQNQTGFHFEPGQATFAEEATCEGHQPKFA
ncbi:MAG: hypothetical protein ABIV39_17720 [Verrucomicrobiota bacterium]